MIQDVRAAACRGTCLTSIMLHDVCKKSTNPLIFHSVNTSWDMMWQATGIKKSLWRRFHPTVTLSVIKFLGFEQIFKNALTTLCASLLLSELGFQIWLWKMSQKNSKYGFQLVVIVASKFSLDHLFTNMMYLPALFDLLGCTFHGLISLF